MINFITGNKFKEIANDHLDQDKTYVDLNSKPKIIFVKTDYLPKFKQSILPDIDYSFKLITHNSDIGVYECDFDLLNDTRLIQWFGMNCHVEHEKLTPIPIGIANAQWPHGDEDLLRKVSSLSIPKKDRIYCNFDPNTNILRRSILNDLQDNPIVDIQSNSLDQEGYWEKLASYRYVISPPGNSVDCHRIWESLYLGTIPICLTHISLKAFEELPIIFKETYQDLQLPLTKIKSSCDMSSMSYWNNII